MLHQSMKQSKKCTQQLFITFLIQLISIYNTLFQYQVILLTSLYLKMIMVNLKEQDMWHFNIKKQYIDYSIEITIHIMENRFKQLKFRYQQLQKKKWKHNKIDNVKISQVEINLVIFMNQIKIQNQNQRMIRMSGRIIRRKIKKIKSIVGDDDFALVAKMKQFKKAYSKLKIIKQMTYIVVFQINERKQRKIKMEQNKKKANKIYKM
ncbi:unnamed protein product [Paramecium pentaurelia]|uniref:Transmembrane protein n=1 Tax=Paramecium pentaurelia TaxID=43138 RepID=A0A8S1VRH0_9CILI|nr:unnamed protein product [Paramecium pentaurelia]